MREDTFPLPLRASAHDPQVPFVKNMTGRTPRRRTGRVSRTRRSSCRHGSKQQVQGHFPFDKGSHLGPETGSFHLWDQVSENMLLFGGVAYVRRMLVCSLAPGAQAPQRGREGDAGYDLRCLEPFVLAPGERSLIDTGVSVALPSGTAGLVVPRSGLAAKHGLTVVNAPGLIDSGYRGRIMVIALNTGREPFSADAGDRIAQLVLVDVRTPAIEVVDELPESHDGRAESGFGSSGRS
jgi:dUTP pyrophosphatase